MRCFVAHLCGQRLPVIPVQGGGGSCLLREPLMYYLNLSVVCSAGQQWHSRWAQLGKRGGGGTLPPPFSTAAHRGGIFLCFCYLTLHLHVPRDQQTLLQRQGTHSLPNLRPTHPLSHCCPGSLAPRSTLLRLPLSQKGIEAAVLEVVFTRHSVCF